MGGGTIAGHRKALGVAQQALLSTRERILH